MEEQDQNKLMRTYEILEGRHIHDEGLLMRRIANFLLVNSFLAVAFAAFVTRGGSFRCFSLVLPAVGIATCIIFLFLFKVQLRTAEDWFCMEQQIEDMEVFPTSRNGKPFDPQRRHEATKKEKRIWWWFWDHGSCLLVTLIGLMWITFLVLVLS